MDIYGGALCCDGGETSRSIQIQSPIIHQLLVINEKSLEKHARVCA